VHADDNLSLWSLNCDGHLCHQIKVYILAIPHRPDLVLASRVWFFMFSYTAFYEAEFRIRLALIDFERRFDADVYTCWLGIFSRYMLLVECHVDCWLGLHRWHVDIFGVRLLWSDLHTLAGMMWLGLVSLRSYFGSSNRQVGLSILLSDALLFLFKASVSCIV